jgi:hypothetical protein
MVDCINAVAGIERELGVGPGRPTVPPIDQSGVIGDAYFANVAIGWSENALNSSTVKLG